VTRLAPCESSSVLAGALRWVQASIGFSRGIKALGTWLSPGSVIAQRTIPLGGPRYALRKDAGVMVTSDPS
jgi:hypothetical protein